MLHTKDNDRLYDVLACCLQNHWLHAALLNTLSLMESLGSQKIHRLLSKTRGSEELLKHAAEEARHAWFFKVKSIAVLSSRNLAQAKDLYLSKRTSKNIFNKIEVATSRLLDRVLDSRGDHWFYANYLLSTLIIENMADHFYRAYDEMQSTYPQRIKLRSILKEEEVHLAEVQERLSSLFSPEILKVILFELDVCTKKIYVEWIWSLIHDLKTWNSKAERPSFEVPSDSSWSEK